MAIGEFFGDTADALKRYLSGLYGGLRQIGGDIAYGLGRSGGRRIGISLIPIIEIG